MHVPCEKFLSTQRGMSSLSPLFPHFLYQPIIIFSLTMRLSFHLLNKPVRNFDAKSAPHPFLRIFSPLHYSSLWSFHSECRFASEIPDRLGIFLKTDKTFRGQKVSPQSTYVWTGHTSFFIFHSFHPLSARWGTLSKQQKENALVWVSEIWAAIRVEGNEILYAGRKKDFHMINCPASVSSTLDRVCPKESYLLLTLFGKSLGFLRHSVPNRALNGW